ncbi:MAG: hypothetical protein JO297_17455 [Nitrososphaeraceae archaeon]|nr:hypothetical protein [Nitrososphaeraceae archaeon]
MKTEVITVKFSEIDETVYVQLDSSKSQKTVKAILDNLPIEVNINKWGQELYTDNTPIEAQQENPKSEVNLLDVAYWPEGNALCLFYGPTPISKDSGKILPYSPVNIVGRILPKNNNIIDRVKDSMKVIIKQYVE